jgi:hypothetical protein
VTADRRAGGGLPERAPGPLAAAAALVALEGAVAVAYGLYLAVRALVDDPAESVVGVELGALLVVLLGVGMLAAARALLRRRGWARGPVTTVQLLVLLTALSFLSGASRGFAVGGAVAALLAVAVLVQLFSRPAREAFE